MPIMTDYSCPFSKFPVEVIKLILEEAIVVAKRSEGCSALAMAATLSGVCHQWYQITVNTPTLWRFIHISCIEDVSDSQPLLELLASRVKETPVEISISEVDLADECTKIGDLFLQRFAFIKELAIDCWGVEAINTQILGSSSGLDNCRVESLILSLTEDPGGDDWHCGDLLQRLPSLHKLAIYASPSAFFDSSCLPNSISSLTLSHMRVKVSAILTLFQKLEELEFHLVNGDKKDIPPPGSSIILRRLRRLEIEHGHLGNRPVIGGWLDALVCPLLQEFIVDLGIQRVTDFVSSHPSLHTYHHIPPADIASLALIVPRLQALTVTSTANKKDLPRDSSLVALENSFDQLRELTLHNVTLSEFQHIVRSRCLPRSHPQCVRGDSNSQIQELNLITSWERTLVDMEYYNDPLYKEARKVIWRPDDDPDIQNVSLRWQ